MVGIYKITNPKGEIYIGSSTNLEIRLDKYKSLYRIKTQPLIKNSIEIHGYINHIFEIIEECNINELKNREKYWIQYYNSFEKGLNSNSGGGGPEFHTEEVKEKMSKALKGNTNKTGKTISEEAKLKMSKAKKGNTYMLGKIRNNTTKAKMSKHRKGKTYEEIFGPEKALEIRLKKLLPRKGKTIQCLNDNKIFSSLKEASQYYKVNSRSISSIITGKVNQTKEGLKFKYVS
jgi:group I intron endonuclease